MISVESVLKDILPIYIRYVMFSEDEQETIIHEFLNMFSRKETAEYLKDKCSKCQERKFTKQNMGLYKLDLPNEVVKNICTMHYPSCYRCHHSSTFIEEVSRRKWWKPVDWSLFTKYYEKKSPQN